MARAAWASDWKVGVRVWVERNGQTILGAGRAELLQAIEAERSITQAAKTAGMSYRRAWTMIQEINDAAGEPLVEAAVGGKQGGGARLTDRGRLALEIYQRVRQNLVESTAGALHSALLNSRGNDCIHLAAAISLQEAVGQILAEYALLKPAVRVRTIFGASNELADHVLAGAPGDLFLSAEAHELDRLEAANRLRKGSRRLIARNGLAFIGQPRSKDLHKVPELLASRWKHIALAVPDCPLGRYSRVYLEHNALYDKLLPKVLHVDNSRAVLAAVASGAAEVGLAFSSDAAGHGAWKCLLRVPAARAAAKYEAAIISRERPHAAASALIDFMNSPTARRCFRRCGLQPVSTSAKSRAKS
jgi:molybdenum ABC transporter molybdate-binding protein